MTKFPVIGHQNLVKPEMGKKEAWLAYECGYCGHRVSGIVVAFGAQNAGSAREMRVSWLQCNQCGNPSVIDVEGVLRPSTKAGAQIEGLPKDVERAYEEARSCFAVNAFTACELICRKILMHVGVEKGAKEGESFANYVSYLEGKGYVTPPMKPWVDQIRKHGNSAAHRLDPPNKERAESTLMFTTELLKLVYEMEYLARKFAPTKSDTEAQAS